MSLVSFVRAHKNGCTLRNAIQDSLDLIKYQFTRKIKNIVIKPNMCYYWDSSTGQTTDPRFVAELVRIIRRRVSSEIDISIVESDASAMKCRYAFKMLGYEKIADELGISLVNLSEDETERVEVTAGGQLFRFMVPKTIQSADLRVNVPKIKYLVHTKISGALKNIFGCNPYPHKFMYHKKLDEAIVALNKIMNFDLCLVDGITVCGSRSYKLGLIMASRDPVAIDVAVAKIMGVSPRTVGHVMLAGKEGLGKIHFSARGIELEYFKKRFPKMGAKEQIMDIGYKLANTLGLNNRLGLA